MSAIFTFMSGGLLFFLKRAGYFVKDHWPYILAAVVGLVLFVCIASFFNSCGKSDPVFTPESLNKINTAEREQVEKAIREEITKNAEVKQTVNDRTANTEAAGDQRIEVADENVRKAAEKVIEAKNQGRDVTAEELECILVGTCK